MKGYNLDLYEVNHKEISFLVFKISFQGGKHAGNRGGICLRLYEKPQTTQCPVFIQRNEEGRAV